MSQDDSEEYEAALSAVHRRFAERLLALCQRNGGIYIKGAQIITSIPAVRPEYRKCAPTRPHLALQSKGLVTHSAAAWSLPTRGFVMLLYE